MKFNIGLLLVVIGLFLVGCGKDEPPAVDVRDETVTNLSLTFTPTDGSSVAIFAFEDLGDTSGLPPAQSSEPLAANTTYEIKAEFLTRNTSPVKILSGKIRDAGEDYQIFMSLSPDNVFQSFEYTDMDVNAQPIGLTTKATTSERFTTGSLRITLIENPDKSLGYLIGDGVPSGVGGTVELDVTFDMIIQ